MIRLEDISIGYSPSDPLLSGLNIEADSGELLALVGENGSGKSTLFKSILGIIPFLKGRCLFQGRDLAAGSREERAKQLSFVASGLSSIPALRVREVVALGRLPYSGWTGRLNAEDYRQVEAAMETLHLGELAERQLARLSDGEKQRTMIARALAQDTPLVLLDEPAAHLDIPHKFDLMHMLGILREQGKCVIYSTHDLEQAMAVADKFWVIHEGQVHQGGAEDLGRSGLFDQLFSGAGIHFDVDKGRFRKGEEVRGSLSLAGGNDSDRAWTSAALLRLGYDARPHEKAGGSEGPDLEISGGEGKVSWLLRDGRGGQRVFNSLYALARFLTQDEGFTNFPTKTQYDES